MPPKWLIVGADGGIGSALAARLPNAVCTSRRPSRAEVLLLDLERDPRSWQLPDDVSVAFLCAARCSIMDCRKHPSETRMVNVLRTVQLAERLALRGSFVVFLSTNQVFDGSIPFRKPGDAPCPLTEYGRQKAEAERAILALNGAAVRFTKVFGDVPPLLRTWAESLQRGETIEPFADLMCSPVPVSAAVQALVACGERREPGIVHVSGDRDVSYSAVASLLAASLGAAPELVRPVTGAARIDAATATPHTTLADETPSPVPDTLDAIFERLGAFRVSPEA